MHGRMMFQPLLISSLLEHAATYHKDTPIISKKGSSVLCQSKSVRYAYMKSQKH